MNINGTNYNHIPPENNSATCAKLISSEYLWYYSNYLIIDKHVSRLK